MKLSLRFGIITGLLVGCWNISCFTIVGRMNNYFSLGIPAERLRAYSGLLGIIILITGIAIAIKTAKKRNGNTIGFGQAAKTGVLISVITACILAIFGWFYCTVINPGYTDYMVNEAGKTMAAAGKTSQEINLELVKVRAQSGTATQVLQALIAQSVIGSISSIIIAFFSKTNPSKNHQ